jgi:Fe-Mn family superoxide dismutase
MHKVPIGHPLLVLDMYEHAHHTDYGASAAKYVDAFLQNVNWEEVNRRREAVSRGNRRRPIPTSRARDVASFEDAS